LKTLIAIIITVGLSFAVAGARHSSVSAAQQLPGTREGFHQDLAWSPDGSKISFSWNGEGNFEIYLMGDDGSGVANLTRNPASDRYASWSPDGAQIAFASDRAAKDKPDIYVMRVDGSNVTRLTRDGGSFPSWSRDGKRIAFMSRRDGHWQIYVMNANGSEQRKITSSQGNDENPSFAPDSEHVIFESNRDGDRKDQLYVVRIDGSDLKRLTHDENNNICPSFSPDGEGILYGLTRPTVAENEHRIFTRQKDGTGLREITDNGFFARWSPRGDRIAYIAGRYPSTQIYVMNADGSGKRQLR
jgi:Tol biopolymer transport system component